MKRIIIIITRDEAQFFINAAIDFESEGDMEQAVANYKKAFRLNPELAFKELRKQSPLTVLI